MYVNGRHQEQQAFIRLALEALRLRDLDVRLLRVLGRAA